jgi:hypothetical protein
VKTEWRFTSAMTGAGDFPVARLALAAGGSEHLEWRL